MSLPVAILAGGLATRLGPMTERSPKVLLDVAGQPFAVHQIELLRQKGADVRYHDPYVPSIHHNGFEMTGEPDLYAVLAAANCAVVVTDHSSYD